MSKRHTLVVIIISGSKCYGPECYWSCFMHIQSIPPNGVCTLHSLERGKTHEPMSRTEVQHSRWPCWWTLECISRRLYVHESSSFMADSTHRCKEFSINQLFLGVKMGVAICKFYGSSFRSHPHPAVFSCTKRFVAWYWKWVHLNYENTGL